MKVAIAICLVIALAHHAAHGQDAVADIANIDCSGTCLAGCGALNTGCGLFGVFGDLCKVANDLCGATCGAICGCYDKCNADCLTDGSATACLTDPFNCGICETSCNTLCYSNTAAHLLQSLIPQAPAERK